MFTRRAFSPAYRPAESRLYKPHGLSGLDHKGAAASRLVFRLGCASARRARAASGDVSLALPIAYSKNRQLAHSGMQFFPGRAKCWEEYVWIVGAFLVNRSKFIEDLG